MRMSLAWCVCALLAMPLTAGTPAMPADAGPAVHATRGIVVSITDTTLVITRSRSRGEITFVLGPATHRAGAITPGALVSVRYVDERDGTHVATAVTAQGRGRTSLPAERH